MHYPEPPRAVVVSVDVRRIECVGISRDCTIVEPGSDAAALLTVIAMNHGQQARTLAMLAEVPGRLDAVLGMSFAQRAIGQAQAGMGSNMPGPWTAYVMSQYGVVHKLGRQLEPAVAAHQPLAGMEAVVASDTGGMALWLAHVNAVNDAGVPQPMVGGRVNLRTGGVSAHATVYAVAPESVVVKRDLVSAWALIEDTLAVPAFYPHPFAQAEHFRREGDQWLGEDGVSRLILGDD